jgi:ring-1,2-phenylacetyl-CoA epoxidase subunit PaaC
LQKTFAFFAVKEKNKMTTQEALFQYTLRLGDTNLILGQRLSEWTGHGPFLEEDLALTNITLDTTGTAKSLLEYAASIENKDRSADDLSLFKKRSDSILMLKLPSNQMVIMLEQ